MTRLLPPKLFMILVVGTVGVGLLVPVLGPVAWPLRVAGVVPLVGGLALTTAGSALFSRVGTNIVTFDDPGLFVTTGPFTRCRNPIYLGLVVALVGVAAMVGSLTAWLGPVAFWLAADRWYVPFEEARMQATFGSAYDDYRRRVPRWVGPVERTRELTS